jgi:ADP-heptose:LPS heptosyltransferase
VLQIPDFRERTLVRTADAGLTVLSPVARALRGRGRSSAPRRILLLRLERIGDLVMTLEAITAVRTLAPAATIDLVVGSWNAALAQAIPGVNAVDTLDASWLAREGTGTGLRGLLATAWTWRSRAYDLAINFEPDIRSNLVAAASGAARVAGWRSGGGGPLLDVALDYDVTAHTAVNAIRLVEHVFETPAAPTTPLLAIPSSVVGAADELLRRGKGHRLVGIHVSGGRAIKQWPAERFAAVAAGLADQHNAVIVATGSPADRPLVEALERAVAPRVVIDASAGTDLLQAAAILSRLDVFVTGDTGPMHLAWAVGTPVVAVFGPSDHRRYATRGPRDRVVRIDLPCSPCNRIRLPPERCVGHTPDCLVGVAVTDVIRAAAGVLDERSARVSMASS